MRDDFTNQHTLSANVGERGFAFADVRGVSNHDTAPHQSMCRTPTYITRHKDQSACCFSLCHRIYIPTFPPTQPAFCAIYACNATAPRMRRCIAFAKRMSKNTAHICYPDTRRDFSHVVKNPVRSPYGWRSRHLSKNVPHSSRLEWISSGRSLNTLSS